ncbi:prephenate dehydrogenase [Candidatus Nitrosacidococcus sp. I8]|uniref:prephenate dehydrogenase n=1 Tax=Candidatus Nitrosacidococcus sp. I8 TaxID=2942908 RepID=UPI0022265F21|nr:prephenate dehydrogenase/arogenate dehydrogenase family protein [Candidatus Nitrosacidococcus sp. I8]CAH9018395.1 Cyclohexadienyl dehydrogenase [Candidatus Nitrosacidococcus sp. I8]
MIQRLCIVGLGLIGSSLALALKRRGAVNEVIGYDCSAEHREKALNLGIADRVEANLKDALREADIVVLSVPVGAMKGLFQKIAPDLSAQTIMTDVGSAKGVVTKFAYAYLRSHLHNFIPGHPIAGIEKNGPESADSRLFVHHKVILTPLPENNPLAIEQVTKMWEYTGATVVKVSISHHDEVLAMTSHLPHILAYALVDLFSQCEHPEDFLQFSAGGFRDFSRVASSNPIMWRDICIANHIPLLNLIDQYIDKLGDIREAILQQDANTLTELFTRAKSIRDSYL